MPHTNKNRPLRPNTPSPSAAGILDQLEMWGQKLGLERIQATLDALDRPDRSFPIVLVAGTNGKGSTAAFLSSILDSAGYRCGLFTSPHLQSVRERIRVAGQAIGSTELHQTLEDVVTASTSDAQPLPSYFEAVTATALLYFARRRVQIAVLEVGLGGRLDATNATEPLLSIITSIAHDHQEHLGHRLDQIAREKAGIARTGRPLLVWAPGQAGVQRVLRELTAQGVRVEETWRSLSIAPAIDPPRHDTGSQTAPHRFTVRSSAAPPDHGPRTYQLESQLAGDHQQVNAAIALRAAERLGLLGFDKIDSAAITDGIQRCRWPGRLETIDLSETTGAPQIVLDGAHNLAGARALAAHLAHAPEEPLNLLFGSLRGKKSAESLLRLAPLVDRIWITTPTSHRALPATDLLPALERSVPGFSNRCRVISSFEAALAEAVEASTNGLLVCGSLYAVGEARTWLHRQFGQPKPAADLNLFAPRSRNRGGAS